MRVTRFLTTALLVVLAGTQAPAAALPHGLAAKGPTRILHVDCAAATRGDGAAKAPFQRVTDAVAVARGLAPTRRVVISIRPGTCAAETLPIVLDFPVWVRGSRVGLFDDLGFPTGAQKRDTVIVYERPTFFFTVTGDGVRISGLSLDGLLPPPPPPAVGTVAIDVIGAQGLRVHGLRIVRVVQAMRTTSASASIEDSYFGDVSSGVTFQGGDEASPAIVRFVGNRVDGYGGGGVALAGAGSTGTVLKVKVTDNDFVTSQVNTGPSNPYGIRIGPIIGGTPASSGEVRAIVARNQVHGTHRYGVIVNGNQVIRTTGPGPTRACSPERSTSPSSPTPSRAPRPGR